MKTKVFPAIIFLLVAVVAAFAQTGPCSLKREKAVKDFEAEVSPGGTVVKISKPDSPFDGCELEVPAQAITASQTVAFGHAKGVFTDAQGQAHDVMILRISPFQKTTSGNGYTDQIVSFKVPAKTAGAGGMLMGFYFDTKTNRPDGFMMRPSEDGAWLIMETRHFNSPFFFLGLK